MAFKRVEFFSLDITPAKLSGAKPKVEFRPADELASVNPDFVVKITDPKPKTKVNVGQNQLVEIDTPPNTCVLEFHTGETMLAAGTRQEMQDRFNDVE